MSRLQGQSTLSGAEKVTEAKKYLAVLKGAIGEMTLQEIDLITTLEKRVERFGNRTMITNRELSWLRDINAKY